MQNNFTFNVIKDDIDFTPKKAKEFDTGYDVKAYLPNGSIIIPPFGKLHELNTKYNYISDYNHVKIPLGFSIDINQINLFMNSHSRHREAMTCDIDKIESIQYKIGFELRIRSGIAFNHGIQGHLGTIDNTYSEMLSAMLYNTSNIPYEIRHGDRIGQIVVELIPLLNHGIKFVDKLSDLNKKGRSGFGSTGVN